ncbi:hypothetical protein OESDEN_09381 [Oesophagostomum dentatum]|uniref:Uncharacterized protein n=1 Tax=Oesophagostomum dentatum TaxID=61180 RepID=A0A0B1T5U6_OESDE|nr:hypothetical protein OESDEN_09381 [Oesophagostomum dentatum]
METAYKRAFWDGCRPLLGRFWPPFAPAPDLRKFLDFSWAVGFSLKFEHKLHETFRFSRLKLLRADVPAEQLPAGCSVSDLLPAVNVKEKIEVNGESRLVQKKKTIYPEWEKCWDTAVTEGRILQIVLMFNQTPVVEATMRLELGNRIFSWDVWPMVC